MLFQEDVANWVLFMWLSSHEVALRFWKVSDWFGESHCWRLECTKTLCCGPASCTLTKPSKSNRFRCTGTLRTQIPVATNQNPRRQQPKPLVVTSWGPAKAWGDRWGPRCSSRLFFKMIINRNPSSRLSIITLCTTPSLHNVHSQALEDPVIQLQERVI